jgi:hypothetical protein
MLKTFPYLFSKLDLFIITGKLFITMKLSYKRIIKFNVNILMILNPRVDDINMWGKNEHSYLSS